MATGASSRTTGCGRAAATGWPASTRCCWKTPQPALLVAHSLGCQLVAAWAAHSAHTARVRGALLVAPPDTERDDMPPQPVQLAADRARSACPSPAIVVVSSDDPYCALPRAAQMAADWGAERIEIGPRGHINGDSGLGDWPDGLALLSAWRPAAR